jgi:tRNA threonylcarbamoyl adenosine modification protein YeaZ
MNILSIDTSGDSSSISSKIGDDLLSFQISHQRKERPDWENFLNHIGIFSNEDIKRFDLLVFGRGPGSYTAIRSSATFLKAISHTNKIPLMAVSNMESLAYKYFQKNKTTDDIFVLINSDIQDEFFYGKFNFNKKSKPHEELLASKETQYQALKASTEIIIGNGNDISNKEYLKSNAEDHLKLAEYLYDAKFEYRAIDANPVYLKPTNYKKAK